jgi:hypothetical protein
MQKKTLAAVTSIGLAAAIAIPTIAFGNARSDLGSLHFVQVANTPFVAQLSGANEVPAADPDGVGAATVTFDILNTLDLTLPDSAEACWDLSYSNILTPPIMAHIHRGVAGAIGPVVVPFTPFTGLGASSAKGCIDVTGVLANEIMTTPSNFYVNIHTTDYTGGAIRGQLAAGPTPAGEAHLLPVPLRAYDSRDAGGTKLAALQTRTISLATGKDIAGVSHIAVPPGATAAIVTLTVTETVGPGGFVKLYSAGISEPATSSINWAGTDQNIAVSTQVSVDPAAAVKITGGANSTHVVIDVIGYLF